jgi:radical SAM superfamily enzyme YgiQ (UPF0313 family)
MKVLLISPNIKGFKNGINRVQPPLGLAYLTSYLKDICEVYVKDTAIDGYEIEIPIDDKMVSIGETDNTIEKYIQEINPDIIGISVLFANLMDSVHTIVNIAKKINKKIITVVGGNHITNIIYDYKSGIDNIDYIRNNNIDYFFIGESELNFVEFVKKIKSKSAVEDIPGLCVLKEKIKINQNTNFLDISDIKDPSWEYFNMEKYFSVGLFHSAQSYSNRVLPVMSSRGCPEKCQFCTTPITWGSKVRWKNPKLLYNEIKKSIIDYKIGEIQFQDDTITANLKNLYELCNYLEEFNLPWCTPNGIKINYHQNNQYEMFLKMKKSGCYQITFACESGSQNVLDNIIRKNIKVNTFKDNIKKAKDAGLFVHSFWIVGFPGETKEEMEKTIEVASLSGADSFSLSIFNPLPGTPLYHKVIKENLWWDSKKTIDNMTFRNSIVKVDGFNSPDDFESFVEKNNYYLNNILKSTDKDRYDSVTKNRGVNLRILDKNIKQT